MVLKKLKKGLEIGVGDIRALALPAEVDKTPELIFDPETSLTLQEWEKIIKDLENIHILLESEDDLRYYTQVLGLFYLVAPKKFETLNQKVFANLEYCLLYFQEHDCRIGAEVYSLISRITKKPETRIETIETQINSAFSEVRDEPLLPAIKLLFLYPEHKDLIDKRVQEFLSCFLPDSYEAGKLQMQVFKKLFFPEHFSAKDFSQTDFNQELAYVKTMLGSTRDLIDLDLKEVFTVLLFLKLVALKQIKITEQGFVEGAKEEAALNAAVSPQPETLNF